MRTNELSTKKLLLIALPISLQSLLNASLSVIDQIMVSSLGSLSMAGIGIASRLSNIYAFTLGAIATTASIIISQGYGRKEKETIKKGLSTTTLFALVVATLFLLVSLIFPKAILSIFTTDNALINLSIPYMKIVSIGFIISAFTSRYSTLLRASEDTKSPLYASFISAGCNTALNYVFLYLLKQGIAGVATATVLSRAIEAIIIYFFYKRSKNELITKIPLLLKVEKKALTSTLVISLPLMVNELLWSVGDTLYSVVYGRMGTVNMAAMTMTFPLQGLCIGLFSGLSSAAGIIIGQELGKGEREKALSYSSFFIKLAFIGGIILGFVVYFLRTPYLSLFQNNGEEKLLTYSTLAVYSFIMCFKVSNMTAGSIISSGGKTKITFCLDMCGTYLVGIPLAFLAAFAFHLSLPVVYLLLSVEEILRLLAGVIILKKGIWINKITL